MEIIARSGVYIYMLGHKQKIKYNMESNEILKKQFLEIVNNQIKSNTPPETNQTLKRLKETGYSENDARMLIGQCVVVEIFDVIKHGKPFDKERYIKNLKNLPKEPFDD